jgi:hypothetical protein
MWDYISDRSTNLKRLKDALKRVSAILVTDGSYSQTRGSHVSRAGWIVACRKSWELLKGSFFELSLDAGSYRGELLGLVALHTLVLQLCKYYHITSASRKIICDNKAALRKASHQRRRNWPGIAQADLFRALCTIHQEMPGTTLQYEWVKSHQDSSTAWHCLLLETQLNTT